MKKDPKEILSNVLDIIDYKNDRDLYIKKFIDISLRKTILKTVEEMSEGDKKILNSKLSKIQEIDKIINTLQEIVGKEKYLQKIGQVSREMFTGFIKSVVPTLSPQKKRELKVYLSTLSQL